MKIEKILSRVYVEDMEKAVRFYETMTGESCFGRFKYEAIGLELASVNNILIIGGSESALKPFRRTQATFVVDSVMEFKEFLLANQGEILADVKEVPSGWNMTVKHFDGTIVEYVEHKAGFGQ